MDFLSKYRADARVVACVLLLASTAYADVAAGKRALDSGDYATALREFQSAADKGDPEAEDYLGFMYLQGHGVAQDLALGSNLVDRSIDHGGVFSPNELCAGYFYGSLLSTPPIPFIQSYEKAARRCRQGAEQGQQSAQLLLAYLYYNGLGVAQDRAEAAKWFTRSAEQGDVIAQRQMGQMFENGQGVQRDMPQAGKWYRRAAEQGYRDAQILLAIAYAEGKGVPQDFVLSYMWSLLGATSGDESALKLRDATAELLSKDQIAEGQRLAREWRAKPEQENTHPEQILPRQQTHDPSPAQSSVQPDPQRIRTAPDIAKRQDRVEHSLPSDSVGEPQATYQPPASQDRDAVSPQSSRMGDYLIQQRQRQTPPLSAAAQLASAEPPPQAPQTQQTLQQQLLVDAGHGDTAALQKLRTLAEQGDKLAQFCLGAFYVGGVSKDAVQAASWFRRAAEQGFPLAQAVLGDMYKDGNGVPKDAAQAVAWYRKAAEQGNVFAQGSLGFMYHNGEGVRKNAAQAAAWTRKAADQGDASAQFNMGAMYENGEGVRKNSAEAVAWYRKAAEQGQAGAQARLHELGR